MEKQIKKPKPPKPLKPPSDLEALFILHMRVHGITRYERERTFHPDRKWRFDFIFIDEKIAVECDGGTWSGGRHTRGSGFEKDCEKMNAAVLLGWRVLRFTTGQVKSGYAISTLVALLDQR